MRLRQQLAAYSPISAIAIANAARRLAAGDDVLGAIAELLEQRFVADDVLMTSSATTALSLAMRAAASVMGTKRPCVALPAFSCYEVGAAAVGAEAEIHLYDLDPETLSPDLDSLESVIRRGASIVIAAPLFGFPVDWDGIERLALQHGAFVIEDAAQGHGAHWHGRPLGALGRLSVVSFGRGKGWTGSSGGALLARSGASMTDVRGNAERPSRLQDAKLWLAATTQWALGRPALYGAPASIPSLGLGRTIYHPPRPPTAMAPFAAALALETREAADAEAVVRRETARVYRRELLDVEGVSLIRELEEGSAGYLRFPVRVRADRGMTRIVQRDEGVRLGVASAYPTSLDAVPDVASRTRNRESSFPGARTLVQELITLPTHSRLKAGERREILALFGGSTVTGAERCEDATV